MSNTNIQCGTLQHLKSADGRKSRFKGKVRLIGRLNGELELLPHPNAESSTNDQHPDYEVLYQPIGDTESYPVGSAWQKPGERVGEFLSITMMHPDWDKELNLSAFPPNKPGEQSWRVVWSRPRAARVQDQPTQAAA